MQTNQPGLTSPCYAVIFTSTRTDTDDGYAETAALMLELARSMPGFLGVDSAREEIGLTVSYWESLEAIRAWKEHPKHRAAQEHGRRKWYSSFTTRVCRVERVEMFP
ncbi:antibiotic biosynthesis monooxygenase [Pseudodesulfovibrio thermohalotolerans]|uniref:antibiotic biosynthesis monooxygenase family protein n=1 Tax=Pseudodesulfovibrio thermohalotolerans TaxID=2880651 RepID=UPI0024433CBA|nr:antibiotic biosynthesis monooxygenase [Pseudodesulfovibrio thermohalotolerans]WFS61477.1 antibiotic biosynthesis monooxygenase [Pseudodesulfovibrio thermohalotolerans]